MLSRYRQFEIIQEPWSVYDLNDGTQVRVRCCLELVYDDERPGYLRHNNQKAVWCSEDFCSTQRKRQSYSMAQLQRSIEERCTAVEGEDNEPSKYRLMGSNSHLILHPVVRNIFRTKLHDYYGDRIYLVDFGTPTASFSAGLDSAIK